MTVISDFPSRLASAKAGDEASFAELFRSVQPALLRYLHTGLGRDLAEDAAAETWLGVVRGLHRFRGDESGWRAWVFTIAHARLRDAQRRAARLPIPVDLDQLLVSHPDELEVDTCVEGMFSTEQALALIARLPADQARVVLLRYVAGLDVAHTARVLGKRPGAVRVAGHRGIRRLTAMLGGSPTVPSQGSNAADEVIDY